MLAYIISLVCSFFLGSIPTGYLIGKYLGIDIRKSGSKNTGATNTARVAGKKAGAATLLLDLLKGALPASLPLIIYYFDLNFFGFRTSQLPFESVKDLSACLGFAAILGHCYSPFLKFKGGKGVATAAGMFLVFASLETLVAVLIFSITFYLTKFVSLSSIVACLCILLLVSKEIISSYSDLSIVVTIAVTLIIIYKHKENILRLIKKEESKFVFKKK